MLSLKFPFRLLSKDNERMHNRRGMPFLSKKFKDFEQACGLVAKSQYKGLPLMGNLKMTIVAFYTSKVHPDVPNLGKSICDGLKGICYGDDRQIKNFKVAVAEGMAGDRFEIDIEVIE